MAFEGFLKFVDDALGTEFAREPFNATKARKPLLKQIAAVRKHFESGKGFKKPRGGQAWGAINNNIVKFTPNLDGAPLAVDGRSEFHIPSERFPEALTEFEKEVNAGAFDAQLSGEAPAPVVRRRGRRAATGEQKGAVRTTLGRK